MWTAIASLRPSNGVSFHLPSLYRTALFDRSMAASNRRLVDEANLVSREMMDVAITWHEFW